MNTIGIDNNLDRPRIHKLLTVGLFAAGCILAADDDHTVQLGLWYMPSLRKRSKQR